LQAAIFALTLASSNSMDRLKQKVRIIEVSLVIKANFSDKPR